MLRYSDDTVLIPENKEDLRQLLTIFLRREQKKGLQLNSKKIELMVISQSYSLRTSTSLSKVIKLKQRGQFKYLGTLISSDGHNLH